ncbi:hypothetical protein [Hymenobacter psychrophilus]|uniref:Uncharacterized protein n=1 Tax=Hymenobacter psychrophilus TaxID=651662 RepID=A0A1H3D8K3_9BACT|nr:hypothetical protein [Hymenobacter psychrophilus]SDX62620.1 hypothetical protein SAMN04488069_102259 [Hymenobacter psychrophilus]
MLYAVLLLDPDYGVFYGFLAVIPSICIAFFLLLLTLLHYITKHFSCLVIFALLYLITLFLLGFAEDIELDTFVPWIKGISTSLLLLNISIYFWIRKRKGEARAQAKADQW